MLLGGEMEKKFTWVLGNFSSLQGEKCYSRPFAVAGCNWRLLAYPKGSRGDSYFSVYLYLDPGSLPPGWRRDVKFHITLVNQASPKSNKVLGGQCSFDAEMDSWGFDAFLPLYKLRDRSEGFLVNDRLIILAEVDVLPAIVIPVEPVKIIASSQETENASNENLDDDDDASEEGLDGDATSEEGSDDDDDDDDDDATSEEVSDDDDDASQEDPDNNDDDDASSPVSDDPLNQSNALEDASHTVENNGRRCNSVGAENEVSNGENDDAPKEDVHDEASSLVSNDSVKTGSSLDQVKPLEDASQTVENDGRGFNTVASAKETFIILVKEIQTMDDVNGFEVVSSQVESVRRIFERHPYIAVEFRAKNQHLRNACMNFLLSLIETLCQSLEELSNEDLVEADIALTYLKDAGFKVDWLEKKLDQLKENKEKEQSVLARLHEIEENLLKLKQKCSDLDALAEKEKAELSATRTSMSFDDLV